MSSQALLTIQNFNSPNIGSMFDQVPITGSSNLSNITIVGNTFIPANSEDLAVDLHLLIGAPNGDVGYTIEVFDETAGVAVGAPVTSYINGNSIVNGQSYIIEFTSVGGHAYSIRAMAMGGGAPNNKMQVRFGQAFIRNANGSGGGGVITATLPLIVTGTNIALGTAVGPTTADAASSVTWSPSGAASKALVLQGIAAQSANLLELQTSTGAVSFAVTIPSGVLTGLRNQIAGAGAGVAMTSGSDNTLYGSQAGAATAGGTGQNTFIGSSSGVANTTGATNTFVGYQSGAALSAAAGAGSSNTAVGGGSLSLGATVAGATAVGANSLRRNTATNAVGIGRSALFANTSATGNVAVGASAGFAVAGATDNNNTFVGDQAGLLVNGSATGANVIIGAVSAGTLTTGGSNTVIGTSADVGAAAAANLVCIGQAAVAPTGGTVIGNAAGKAGATAARFTCVGNTAGAAITGGADNVFIGDQCAKAITTGNTNVCIGSGVLSTATGNAQGVWIGYQAGNTDTTNNAAGQVSIGYQAGKVNTGANTFIGWSAGVLNTSGSSNTFVGLNAGAAMISNSQNTFVGNSAGATVTGSYNTAIGCAAGSTILSTGSSNLLLGNNADTNATGTSNAIILSAGGVGNFRGSSTSIIIKTAAITSATTNDLIIETGDSGLRRVSAGVINSTNGAGVGAWFQNTAGSVRQASNYTNATSGFTATSLSVNVTTGRFYSFMAVLVYANSTAGEGAQFDFNGGSATSTNFVAGTEGAINDTVTTSLAGVFSQATVTGNNITTILGTFEPSSTGTFIIRAAEVSHVSGTLTLLRGSYLVVWDMP